MSSLNSQNINAKAFELLHRSCLDQGIVASANEAENYRRVWARDGIIAGLAGLLYGDQHLIEHLGKTVDYLRAHQHLTGIIPSNVGLEPTPKVSYGSTAGRVDATTWWVAGALLLLRLKPEVLKDPDYVRKGILKAMHVLEIWEMNLGDLIYTPIGGNWADEFVIQGHTLYDNLLRLWGLRLAAEVFAEKAYAEKAKRVEAKIQCNYMHTAEPTGLLYHAEAYRRITYDPGYLFASVSPMGYDTRWDMAGNALALLLGFTQKIEATTSFLEKLAQDLPHGLVPAFWPVITPEDAEWSFLANNYNYRFKNEPYYFHNGGSWPVFSGLMCLALAAQGKQASAAAIQHNMLKALEREQPAYSFCEYFETLSGTPQGMQQLCYAASGWLFADMAVSKPLHNLHEILP